MNLRALVERLLAKAPQDRPVDALQVRQTLENAIKTEGNQLGVLQPLFATPLENEQVETTVLLNQEENRRSEKERNRKARYNCFRLLRLVTMRQSKISIFPFFPRLRSENVLFVFLYSR